MKHSKNLNKKRILCFIEYYLPGCKSGGPVKTISNFVEYFGQEYEIFIICSDRDYLDTKPYVNKKIKKWYKIGKAKVLYISKKDLNIYSLTKLLSESSYDLLYINGLFSLKFNILPLLIRRFKPIKKNIPCILATRGMLSPNAIKLKSIKKKIYLKIANFFQLYENLFFQASNFIEKKEIHENLKVTNKKIFIAPNLVKLNPISPKKIKVKKNRTLNLIFLSRISPMKNLDFLLRSLFNVDNPINLTIHGSKEDHSYYNECLELIRRLPKKIKINVKNHIKNESVQNTLINYDLFVLPSRGENFGHIIIEALSAGLPVLISDKVFWKSDKKGGIIKLPLKEEVWAKEILKWSNLSKKNLFIKKKAALMVANNYIKKNISLKKNKDFLNFLLKN